MLRNSGFSPRDWDMAPHYASPVDVPGMLVLDFDELGRLAREEEASGAFRAADDAGTLAKAPVFLDDLPGAFYKVDAHHPDFTPNHNTSERETLVVMQGALRVVYNHGLDRDDPESQAGVVSHGQVVELEDEAVSLQVVSLFTRSAAWALAIYRDLDGRMRPDLRIV